MTKPFFALIGAIILSACTQLPDNSNTPNDFIIDPQLDGRMRNAVDQLSFPDHASSAFLPIADGLAAFAARVQLVEAADHSLDIQYYIWHDDLTGRILIKRVLDAAERGVRVRLLLDDIDTSGKELGLQALNHHPMISIRLFNPITSGSIRAFNAIGDLDRVNRRMHNKSLTADGTAVIIGGRNIGNEYFSAEAHASFADFDVVGVGAILEQSNRNFDDYWNSTHSYPLELIHRSDADQDLALNELRSKLAYYEELALESDYMQALNASQEMHHTIAEEADLLWGDAYLLTDSPEKLDASEVTIETHVALQLHRVLSAAEQEVLIVSPYFVPTESLLGFFNELISEGIRVRILTNSLSANDVSLVHAGYLNHREALLEMGVELFEYRDNPTQEHTRGHWYGSSRASLHAKTITIDDRYVFVGSFNVDPRSMYLNTEMGVLIENKAMADGFEKALGESLITRAYEVTLVDGKLTWRTSIDGEEVLYDHEPETSWWTRAKTRVLSWFVIEDWL